MKRTLALLLALMLLLTGMALAESADWEKQIPVTPYAETIKISTLGIDPIPTNTEISYDENDPRRIGPNENVWIDAHKKYLNVEVERIIAEDDTALSALVNTMMASGDLPDVALVSRELFNTMVENEVAMDLTDIWASYEAGQMMKDTFTQNALQYATIDGRLMGIPMGMNNYNNTKVLWIRQDWLDKVGMEAPKTWDELCAVAKAFIDAKLGGEYTIGIGFDELNDGPFAAFDVALKTWKEAEDGSWVYDNTSENMKTALLALQKAYADGLINKDFAVSKGIGQEVANGHCGLLYGAGWVGSTDINNCYVNDTSAEWIGVPVPTVTGERVKQWTNATVNSFLVITENCENPEAVLKMIDLELFLCYAGASEEAIETYYSYVSDQGKVPIWNLRVFRNISYTDMYDLTISRISHEAIANGLTTDDLDQVVPYAQNWCNGLMLYHYGTPEERTEFKAQGKYGFRNCVMGYGYPIIADLADAGLLVSEFPGTWSETMNIYWKSLDEALNAAALEVIMGKDISLYEEAIDAWYAGGGQTITEEVTAFYNAGK